MASTPFTLAALATSAVSGLEVMGTREHTSGSGGAFTSAVLETSVGDVIVRVPTTPAAEVQQSGELLGLSALGEGTRQRIPFAVPLALGMTRAGDTRAVVTTFLPGIAAAQAGITSNPLVLQSVAETIAAIHSLPSNIVQQAGLAMRHAEDVRLDASRLVQRGVNTGVLPETVRSRWHEALDADSLWSFEATVVHGALDADRLLVEQDTVTGVLGWEELSLGDPAVDLAWLLGVDEEIFTAALAHYSVQRGVAGLPELTARARFHHELEVVRWLLHGVETHDQSIVDDAVRMMDRLVDQLGLLGAPMPRQRVLSEEQVEQLLDETPVVAEDPRSETAEFEALDDDRVFEADPDFGATPGGSSDSE